MEASSREALALTRGRLVQVTGQGSGESLLALAEELFAVARLLDSHVALRRALSDPSAKPAARAGVARKILGGRVTAPTLDLVETVAQQRWSRPVDLVRGLETLATEAALDAAAARGELDGVEDELFRFGRIVAGDRELSRLLSDRAASAAGRTELLDRLLAGRVSPVTLLLLRAHLSGRVVGNAEDEVARLSDVAAERRGRHVARVTSATPLTPAQERRLADVLSRLYGRAIGLQVTVDPSVLGGLVIRVGDEIIDGSVAHRLDVAGRQLTG